jgi:NADPH:quinone reductase-like Zn-dependent oxidoreductase
VSICKSGSYISRGLIGGLGSRLSRPLPPCLASWPRPADSGNPSSRPETVLSWLDRSLTRSMISTRSMLQTADMAEQHALLDRVAGLVDAGKIRTTVAEHFGTINAANLKRAHALLETGKARGKIVVEGF